MEGSDLRILIPFYNVRDLDFYFHLVKSLKRCFREIWIAYVVGEVEEEWRRFYSFKKLKLNTRRSKNLKFFFSRKNVYEQLKHDSFDVIFALSELWNLEFSFYLSKKLKIPFVVWVRGDHRKVKEVRKINWIKRMIVNRLEVSYLNQAAFVVPNCFSLYEKLHEWGVDKSRITEPVHNGVNTEVFRPMNVPRSDRFTVAYAGRICPEKRVAELLRIAERLKDVEFIVAGYKSMDVKFPINVKYLGRLPFNRMPEFYNSADVVVLPSVTEGFPSVILEAYACEKPVLAAREAFPKELKLFGAVADLSEFEQKIRELQRADLGSIGREARVYVRENFSWERFAKWITKYILEAVRGEDRS